VVRGKATTKPWIPASMLETGGVMVYALGSTPDLTWGNGPGDVPPQLTAPQSVSGFDIAARAGARFNGVVAAVTDEDTAAAALSATIDWGDGTRSAGTVVGSGGRYTVVGRHVYKAPGRYTVTTTVSDPGGMTVVSANGTALVGSLAARP
jgi:hypothetical protein